MKLSGKIEDGTSNEPLKFGSDPWPWRRLALSERRFALSECFYFCISIFFTPNGTLVDHG